MLGLDPAVQAVYTAMLTDPGSGITELAEQLALPEAAIRQALDKLADLALLRPSREQPGRMLPVNPAAGLQALIRRQEEELAERRRAIEASQAAAARMIADHALTATPQGGSDSEHLIGLDAIQTKFEELSTSATVETLSLVPGKAIPVETLAAARALDSEQMIRRVPGKVLYQDAVRNDPATVAYGLWMIENGVEVRTAPVLPQRLYVVDYITALVPLDPTNPSVGALCTIAPGIVSQLVALFNQLWAGATPLNSYRHVNTENGLTDFERELLKLLASGSTDDAAANRLGVSVRTVKRRMEDLMRRLDAGSRFEAGLKAGQRGWL